MSRAPFPSRLQHSVTLIGVLLLASCSSSVQDLGRNASEPTAEAEDPSAHNGHEGFGAAWACPDSPLGRDLACPLTRPADGDACGSRNAAPCAFVGAPPSAPDTKTKPLEPATTFCICTRDLRWACLQDVTMRTLATPLLDGDPCEDSLSIEQGGVRCTCERGHARCAR